MRRRRRLSLRPQSNRSVDRRGSTLPLATPVRDQSLLQNKIVATSTTFLQPAGVSHVRVPWGSNRGTPKLSLVRDGVTLMGRWGKLKITDTPMGNDGEGTRNFNQYSDLMSIPAP